MELQSFIQDPELDIDCMSFPDDPVVDCLGPNTSPGYLSNSIFHDIFTADTPFLPFNSEPITTYHSQSQTTRSSLSALKSFHFKSRRKHSSSTLIKPPKKAYFLEKLIRGHKYSTRKSLSGRMPKRTLSLINIRNVAQVIAWGNFCAFNLNPENSQVLDNASQTESGPLTDGRTRGNMWRTIGRNAPRTFNIEFYREYLRSDIVVDSFLLYLECLFADPDYDVICEKFNFRCCSANTHNDICKQKWVDLRKQVEDGFINKYRNS